MHCFIRNIRVLVCTCTFTAEKFWDLYLNAISNASDGLGNRIARDIWQSSDSFQMLYKLKDFRKSRTSWKYIYIFFFSFTILCIIIFVYPFILYTDNNYILKNFKRFKYSNTFRIFMRNFQDFSRFPRLRFRKTEFESLYVTENIV